MSPEEEKEVIHLRSKVGYAYALLREFDNYGSGDLDVCVREVVTVVSELRTRVTELQARGSALENERRGWKVRAVALRSLLDATLIDLRVGFAEAVESALSGRAEVSDLPASFTSVLEKVAEVAARNWQLERSAWCGASNVAREFLEACKEPLGDYAPDAVLPGEGGTPESAFIRRWRERFDAVLKLP